MRKFLFVAIAAFLVIGCGTSYEYEPEIDDSAYYELLGEQMGAELRMEAASDAYDQYVDSRVATLDAYANRYEDDCFDGCTYHAIGCDIKGNISLISGEKIYHIPGQEFYDATVISPEAGERWFCSEAEAIANGWRKAYQ